jgi:HEAT repeats
MKKSRKFQLMILWLPISSLCFCFNFLSISIVRAEACSEAAINSYIKKLDNTNEWIFTVAALKKCGDPAVKALSTDLQHKDETSRINAVAALGSMGTTASSAIPILSITTLADKSPVVRSSAAYALGSMGAAAESAVPALTLALQDEDRAVRAMVVSAIGSLGRAAESAVPALSATLRDRDRTVRSNAVYAWVEIATSWQKQAKNFSRFQLEQHIRDLETALKIIEISKEPFPEAEVSRLRSSWQILRAERYPDWSAIALQFFSQYQWLAIGVVYIATLTSFWSLLLWQRPLWILHINNALQRYTNIALPGFHRIRLPIDLLILVSFFNYHPRVLNAWFATQTLDSQVQQNSLEPQSHRYGTADVPSLEPESVQKYAKAIAWECIKQTFQPTAVKREQLLHEIGAIEGCDTAKVYLQHLEQHLGLLQASGKTQDKVRFTHDLLAEYLASQYLVELCCDNESHWRKFLARVDTAPDLVAIKRFLLSVRDCCIALQTSFQIPEFAIEELSQRVGIAQSLPPQIQGLGA